MCAGKVLMSRGGLALSLITVALSGCGGTDLSDYRPVDKGTPNTSIKSPADATAAPNRAIAADVTERLMGSRPYDASEEDLTSEEFLPVSALGPVNVINGASVSNLLKQGDKAANPVGPQVIQPVSATIAETTTTDKTTTDKPRTVELLVPDKSFQRDRTSNALRVSYDDLDLLKVLNMEPVTSNAVELMPAWLTDLNGQRIRIRGFMFPTFEAEGLERFVLARDNQICCFGRDPKVYDVIQVDMHAGKTTRYIPATRSFDVVGRLKIDFRIEDGKPFGLYCIEDAEVIER